MSVIEKLSDLRGAYDAVFCDAWGVIHNGIAANVSAVRVLKELRLAGKTVIILTNAPRTAGQLREYFHAMGVDADCYDGIISSGEVGRDVVVSRKITKLLHLGPKIDEELFRGCNIELVSSLHEAEAVFNSGLRDNTQEKADAYRYQLKEFFSQKIPMICVNPDRHVHIGQELRDCAGALAEIFQDMGGSVDWIGKPFKDIYVQAEAALGRITKRKIEPSHILAIGDAVHTDILGGKNMGYQTLFVMNGIHKEELNKSFIDKKNCKSIEDFCLVKGSRPDFCIEELA